jgi:carboxypeptidase family protein
MITTVARLALIAIGSTFALAANAQTPGANTPSQTGAAAVASAKGKVVGASNEPQPGVPVQIKGPLGETVAITDKSGTWSLYNLPAGNYKVQMIGSQKSKPAEAVDFTVKEGSFFDKFSGNQSNVVWSPELKVDDTGR